MSSSKQRPQASDIALGAKIPKGGPVVREPLAVTTGIVLEDNTPPEPEPVAPEAEDPDLGPLEGVDRSLEDLEPPPEVPHWKVQEDKVCWKDGQQIRFKKGDVFSAETFSDIVRERFKDAGLKVRPCKKPE